ncbi:MAG: hypothetical protein GAK35_04164 [Herbaspirillum frisingense]|uniref:Uncharacterized protein n=1 Tax=Herbaspirillum frisingense TaxID=92645 RepID=A0A7V8FSY5_9BURK|nr:MAG: hypothetical protein GAK35_04164 [Herbaspirillum frisingense]
MMSTIEVLPMSRHTCYLCHRSIQPAKESKQRKRPPKCQPSCGGCPSERGKKWEGQSRCAPTALLIHFLPRSDGWPTRGKGGRLACGIGRGARLRLCWAFFLFNFAGASLVVDFAEASLVVDFAGYLSSLTSQRHLSSLTSQGHLSSSTPVVRNCLNHRHASFHHGAVLSSPSSRRTPGPSVVRRASPASVRAE